MKMNNVQCYEGDYDKALFYSKMGRFFAEERYIRQMPYLRNRPEKVWFTVEKDEKVIAFSSVEFKDGYVEFTTEYVEPRYRKKGLFRMLTEARFEYCRDYCRRMNVPIKTTTNIEFIKDYYVRRGFEVYRTTRYYWFLRRDSQEAVYGEGQSKHAPKLQFGA
jgi:GNAT superfamily N-acetyltransferase